MVQGGKSSTSQGLSGRRLAFIYLLLGITDHVLCLPETAQGGKLQLLTNPSDAL